MDDDRPYTTLKVDGRTVEIFRTAHGEGIWDATVGKRVLMGTIMPGETLPQLEKRLPLYLRPYSKP